MKHNVYSMEILGMDASLSQMPNEWQARFIAAGTTGYVPMDILTMLDNRKVLHVRNSSGFDTAIIYQTDSDAEYEAWIQAECVIEAVQE